MNGEIQAHRLFSDVVEFAHIPNATINELTQRYSLYNCNNFDVISFLPHVELQTFLDAPQNVVS